MSSQDIGIFGGTFDPVHIGHLICAQYLCEELDLSKVIFIPCNQPPHKPGYKALNPEHRLRMLRLAIEGNPTFEVSDIEIRRGGISYTIDTVKALVQGQCRGKRIWLLMGLDAFLEIGLWKQPDEIASLCYFGVATRPGFERKVPLPVLKERTRFIPIPAIEVSSTLIRQRLSMGKSIRFLVPENVERYIRRNNLYLNR